MTLAQEATAQVPAFCEGIQYFGDPWPEFDRLGQAPAVDAGTGKLRDPGSRMAAYQTLLYADALRYLTLQMTASKASGHPGGFASQAEAYAALVYLGQKNIPTEVGHHADAQRREWKSGILEGCRGWSPDGWCCATGHW